MDPASSPKPAPLYVYAVVDVTATPTKIIRYDMSRREAREFVRWCPNADDLRIRRGRVTLYTK